MNLVYAIFLLLSFHTVFGQDGTGVTDPPAATEGSDGTDGTDPTDEPIEEPEEEEWKDVEVEGCIDAKEKKPATITLQEEGFLQGVRLIHKEGMMSCSRNEKEKAKFGCLQGHDNNRNKIGVIVTDVNNQIIFPVEAKHGHRRGLYYSGGNHPMDDVITFYNDLEPVFLDESTPLRVWYGEALHDIGRGDNLGKTCFHAQVLFKNV